MVDETREETLGDILNRKRGTTRCKPLLKPFHQFYFSKSEEVQMLEFVDRHWARIYCIRFEEDFDFRGWVVNLLRCY